MGEKMLITEAELEEYIKEYYEQLFAKSRNTKLNAKERQLAVVQMETVETILFQMLGGKECLILYGKLDQKYQ